jgi:hypothetical protein
MPTCGIQRLVRGRVSVPSEIAESPVGETHCRMVADDPVHGDSVRREVVDPGFQPAVGELGGRQFEHGPTPAWRAVTGRGALHAAAAQPLHHPPRLVVDNGIGDHRDHRDGLDFGRRVHLPPYGWLALPPTHNRNMTLCGGRPGLDIP